MIRRFLLHLIRVIVASATIAAPLLAHGDDIVVPNANLKVEGKDVPAGSYTIFTIPTPDKWTLIINKKTGEWGIPYKYQSEELTRVPMTVSKTPSPVENFTISFDQAGGSCTLQLSWENTQATVKFTEKK